MNLLRSAAIVLAMAAPAPAVAATLFGATSFHVFGDSLSDSGRTYDLTFGFAPQSPPYYKGRFSNGPVWAEYVEAEFKDAGLKRSNQAYGGAQATTNGDLFPDLRWQALAYRQLSSSRKGAAPMAAILVGANDITDVLGRSSARAAGAAAAEEVASATRYLSRNGVERFVLMNLPDLGRIPEYALREDQTRAEQARRGSQTFNARLDRRIGDLRGEGLDVQLFDLAGAFDTLFADPGAFGVTDVTQPCLIGRDLCRDAEADRKAFFDTRHPTAVIHEQLADLVLAQLAQPATRRDPPVAGLDAQPAPAPVPLPAPAALLLAALAGLGLAARRRA